MIRTHCRSGFTLIELLIVVAIIGILSAIAIPNFLNAQIKAKVAQTQAEMRSLETSIESYAIDNGQYPLGTGGIQPPGEYSIFNWRLRCLTTPLAYMTTLPIDPFNIGDKVNDYSGVGPGVTTYDYNTYDVLIEVWMNGEGGSMSQEEASAHWQDIYGNSAWKMCGTGPNGRYKPDGWGAVKYDPTNGILSDGDIVLTQGFRF